MAFTYGSIEYSGKYCPHKEKPQKKSFLPDILQNRYSFKLRKIHGHTPVPESFFFGKSVYSISVFLCILEIFLEHLSKRTPPGD